MNEQSLNERESLELIARTIRQGSKAIEPGSGNILLCYGYLALAISLLIYALNYCCDHPIWNGLWLLMLSPYICQKVRNARHPKDYTTYMETTFERIGSLMGLFCWTTLICILIAGMLTGCYNFFLMRPLCLIYLSMGISLIGMLLHVRAMILMPMVGLMAAVYMLAPLSFGAYTDNRTYLIYGMTMLFVLIIPGHVLNKKSQDQC